jgi:hypothetical protein
MLLTEHRVIRINLDSPEEIIRIAEENNERLNRERQAAQRNIDRARTFDQWEEFERDIKEIDEAMWQNNMVIIKNQQKIVIYDN